MRYLWMTTALVGISLAVGPVACSSSDDGSGGSSGSTGSAGAAGQSLGGAAGSSVGGASGAQGGSGGQTGGLKPGKELSVEEYCKGVVAGFCDTQYECCGKDDAKRQACIQNHVSECVQSLNKQISAGTVEYHGEYAAACAEETKGMFACEMDLHNQPETPNCDAAVQGLVEEGGVCTAEDQCRDGLKCSKGQSASGVCYTPAPEGQPCGNGCVSGLVCINDVCSKPLALGEKCTAIDQCGEENYCDGVQLFPPGGEGVCKPRKEAGEPCDPQKMFGLDCKDFMCDPGTRTCSERMKDICQYN